MSRPGVRVPVARRFTTILWIVVVAVAAVAATSALAAAPGWVEAAWTYDAAHDVVPDWLWDAGVPGNPRVR